MEKINETQEKIFQAAGRYFYVKGFKDTTIEDIAKEVDIPKSLVSYYYKKNELMSEWILFLYKEILKEIERQVGHLLINHLQKHVVFTNIFYSIILNDERYLNVYKEVLLNNLIPIQGHQLIRDNKKRIIEELKLSISETMFQTVEIAEYAARKELFLQNYETLRYPDSLPLINFFATIAVRLAGVDAVIIDENVKYANRITDLVQRDEIWFLNK